MTVKLNITAKIVVVSAILLMINANSVHSTGKWNDKNNLIILSGSVRRENHRHYIVSLLLVNPDGKVIKRTENLLPPFEWSPDGTMIFCTKEPRGTFCVVRTSDIDNPLEFSVPHLGGANKATWSPNQRWIALKAGDNAYVVEVGSFHSEKVEKRPGNLDGLIWSPDSRKLAFGTTTMGEIPNAESRIYVYYPETKNVITEETSLWQFRGDWSSDGKKVIFQGSRFIYLFDLDKKVLSKLAEEKKRREILFPKWKNPDIIEYVAPSLKNDNSYWSLYEYDLRNETSREKMPLELSKYTGHPFPFIEPVWNSQHDALVYESPSSLIFKDLKYATVKDLGEGTSFWGWSPDGNKVIYIKSDWRSHTKDYYLIDRTDPDNAIKMEIE